MKHNGSNDGIKIPIPDFSEIIPFDLHVPILESLSKYSTYFGFGL